MWNGLSIADVGNTWQDDAKIKDLVERIAARRTPLEVAQKAVTEFIVGAPAEREQKAKQVFAGVFDTLSDQRREVMDGLERVSRKEMDLSAKINPDQSLTRSSRATTKPSATSIMRRSRGVDRRVAVCRLRAAAAARTFARTNHPRPRRRLRVDKEDWDSRTYTCSVRNGSR